MNNKTGTFARFILIASILACISTTSYSLDTEILLKSRSFIPDPGIDPGLNITLLPPVAHVIIQFQHIPCTEERENLSILGVKLLDYIPNHAFFASVDKYELEEVAKLPYVRSIVKILPEDKVAQNMLEELATPEVIPLITLFFDDATENEILSTVEYYGYVIVEPTTNRVWVTYMPGEDILEFAGEDIVQWIEHIVPENIEHNSGARPAMDVNTVQASPYNLHGEDVTIAEWDSGHADRTHPDLGARIIYGDSANVKDHSTHVAGTAVGNGSLSGGALKGMADKARLITYEWPSGYPGVNEMDSETNHSITIYNAILSTNSWGWRISAADNNCGSLGYYDAWSQNYDDIVHGKLGKEIIVVFSASNERNDGDCGISGRGGYDCIGSPGGTAKNNIVVGAVNSNNDGMTTFSSWGPTNDGRIKPDVVAPGCQSSGDGGINSTIPDNIYTNIYARNCDGTGDDYCYPYDIMCGTSMAAPAVSGSIALMWEELTKGLNRKHYVKPLPSTIKALLIHTAKDLGNTGPDYSYGYGRVNVTYAIDMIRDGGPNNILTEGNVSTNEIDNYTMYVSPGTTELRVTLAWDDEPGTLNAAKELVNDLDLLLIAPNGSLYRPWILNASNPSINAVKGADHVNNVEQVYVNNPLNGTWKINVTGYDIPNPVQKYSLVYENFFPDLFISDSSPDDGSTPSPRPFWTSPDVWVDSNLDGNPDANPEAGQVNHLYARIKNIGAEIASNTNVSFYWANPSGGIPYPGGWNYINSSVIANISPSGNAITHVSWYPNATPAHQCILIRLENVKDPIRRDGSVVWENNIGMKNFWVVDVIKGESKAFNFNVGNPLAGTTVDAFLVLDTSGFPADWGVELTQSYFYYIAPGESRDNVLTVTAPTDPVNDTATVHVTQYITYEDLTGGFVEEVAGGISVRFKAVTSTTTTTSTSTTSTTMPPAGVTVLRDLISPISCGVNLTVTLVMNVDESNPPNSLGLTEYYPSGWIVSDIPLSGLDQGDRIEWICSSLTLCHVEDQNITYTVHVPETASGVYLFNGTIYTTGYDVVGGDTELTVVEWAPVVNVSRSLPDSVYSGSNFTVSLVMTVDESNPPSSLDLTENYPSNWTVSGISPGGVGLGGVIEWVFWAMGNPVQDQNITYTLSIPEGVNGTYEFTGDLYYWGVYSDTTGDTGLTVLAGCGLAGDYPPCGEVSLAEVIDLITLWSQGEADLSDVVQLINAWAFG